MRALDAILDRRRTRPRFDGVNTVLVTDKEQLWNLETLSKEVARVAKEARLVHVGEKERYQTCTTCGVRLQRA